MVLLLAGCGAGSGMNIVSPSASEDEIRTRAKAVMSEKSPSAQSERAVPSQKSQERSQESTAPEKRNPSGESVMKSGYAQDALINLLEKKGIITKEELREEIKRLKEGSSGSN
jgi:hypothetical protein